MDLLSMQFNNVKKLSRNITRAKANNVNVKAQLAASNHPCWSFTTVPSIHKKNNKWHMRYTKRKNKKYLKGKRISSSGYLTKFSTESELF